MPYDESTVTHAACALLVNILLPIIQKTSEFSSEAQDLFSTSLGFLCSLLGEVQFDILKPTVEFEPGSRWAWYGQSKLTGVQYTSELARRFPSATFVILIPSTTDTDFVGQLKPSYKELEYQMDKVIVWPNKVVHSTC